MRNFWNITILIVAYTFLSLFVYWCIYRLTGWSVTIEFRIVAAIIFGYFADVIAIKIFGEQE